MIDLIVRNVRVVSGSGERTADVAVDAGRFVEVAGRVSTPARAEVNGEGAVMLPGLIDMHVHFRTPGHEYKESIATGSAGAVSGGITSFVDMPNTNPSTTTREALIAKRDSARSQSVANFGFYAGAEEFDAPGGGRTANADELKYMLDEPDVAGTKIYMGSTTGRLLVVDPDALRSIFAAGRKRVGVHAEDEAMVLAAAARLKAEGRTGAILHGEVRDPAAAVKAVDHAAQLAHDAKRPLHVCHLTTHGEVELLSGRHAHALERGEISFELCPHHLFLCDDVCRTIGNLGKMNPPLRKPKDVAALWRAMHTSDHVTLATDHAPHTLDEKARDYWQAPAGVPTIEWALPLLLTAVGDGRTTLPTIAALYAERPARLFGIRERGRIAPGMYADFSLVRPRAPRETIRDANCLNNSGWTPFAGFFSAPKPERVYVEGTLVAERGRIVNPDHRGRPLVFAP